MRAPSYLLSIALPRAILVVFMIAGAVVAPASADLPDERPWGWPVHGVREVTVPYRAPAHAYGAGHRGIDLRSPVATPVRAPADGIVAFRGMVVDRPLITIEHDGGLVSTFEPVISELSPGDAVFAGGEIGKVSSGGHAVPGTLHVGARLEGDYINPMLLFGDVPRAILLPCCEPL